MWLIILWFLTGFLTAIAFHISTRKDSPPDSLDAGLITIILTIGGPMFGACMLTFWLITFLGTASIWIAEKVSDKWTKLNT